MPTGIESWSNPGDLGPIYPFVGTEVPLAIVGIVLWILFHVIQTRQENEEWHEAEAAFDERLLLPGSDEPPHVAATNGGSVAATTTPSSTVAAPPTA